MQLEFKLHSIHFCQAILNPQYSSSEIIRSRKLIEVICKVEFDELLKCILQLDTKIGLHSLSQEVRFQTLPILCHLSAWPSQSLHVLCYLRWSHSKSISTALKISLFNYSGCTSYLSGAVAQKNKKRKGKEKKEKRKKIRKEKNATTVVRRDKKLFLYFCLLMHSSRSLT